jgi:hypothetical protein
MTQDIPKNKHQNKRFQYKLGNTESLFEEDDQPDIFDSKAKNANHLLGFFEEEKK